MALIKPFRAWHYHPQKGEIKRLIAPPYDVISEDYRKELEARDPHNVIRLILGQSKPGQPFPESLYQEAGQHLRRWTDEEVLVSEPKESFYLHEMSYQHPFQKKALSRLALFALLKLEPFERKVVFPHERTHASPKVDRGKLLRATHANFSPVFTLYEDPTEVLPQIRKRCEAVRPLFDFTDDEKVHHRLWVIDKSDERRQIALQFDRRRIFIADGHHRYETALGYAEEMRKTGAGGEHPWDYVMSTFVRFNDPGLLILPIHRAVLNSVPLARDAMLADLKKHFVLHSVSRSVLEKISEGSLTEGFGLAFSETEIYLLELKDQTTARQEMPGGKPELWYALDMNLVSFLILEPLLGVSGAALEHHIFYTPSVGEAFSKLKKKEARCVFFIRPTTPKTIKTICESGELMPQKSTYFYPKFPSGLLVYKH
ncbi:MAG: DUF1015 domain-containing protein [Candidatus Omnitrophica bacterium]|nr:DUF1015 domain-containing protein [Candidatus Omnitrophota bacterium]